MRVVLLNVALLATLCLPKVYSQQHALFVRRDAIDSGKRVSRQTSADQMVQNILQWLQGVYTQNSRSIRQGSFREYLPPTNTQKPRPFQPPQDQDNFIGYPPSGISPQPPFPFPGKPGMYEPRPFETRPPPQPTDHPEITGYPGPSTEHPSSEYPGPTTGYPGPSTGYPYPSTESPTETPTHPPTYPTHPPTYPSTYPPHTHPTHPTHTYPTQPPQTYPTQPPQTFPTQPPQTHPTHPTHPTHQTYPTQPPQTYPTQPPQTHPTHPTHPPHQTYPPTYPTQPPQTYPTQPPQTYPTHPPQTYPTHPPQTFPTQPPTRPPHTHPTHTPQTIPTRPPPTHPPQTIPTHPPTYPPPTHPPTAPPTHPPEYETTRPPYTSEPVHPPGQIVQTEHPTEQPTHPPVTESRPPPDSESSGTDEESLKHPPHIHAIDVECAKDMMTINIEFNREFNGIIYSKGYFHHPECRYVQENSGQSKYSFTVSLNSCGTEFINAFDTQGQSYLENVLVLQNEAGIQEVWDTIRAVRCLWEGNLNKALSVALSVGMLSQEIVTFSGDTAMARLDIQLGKGPFAPPANGLVKIGETMTLVVSVTGDPGFDIQVRDCRAKDSTGANEVALTDDNGCVLKPKLFGAFQKTRNTGNSGASIIAYAFFNAFKFPDVMDLMIECNVELCKTDCEVCPDPNQKYEPGRRRKRDLFNETIGDPVTMGKTLRVILPEDLSDGEAIINLKQREELCMSTQSFVLSSAILISLLTSSTLLSAYLWLKNQRLAQHKC